MFLPSPSPKTHTAESLPVELIILGELLHDLRFEADTDTQALAVIDNERAISAHNDKKLVVWNLPHGNRGRVHADFCVCYA